MDINESFKNIEIVSEKLTSMQKIASFVAEEFDSGIEERWAYLSGQNMANINAEKNQEMQSIWSEVQKILPPGFSVDSNLIRHLSFNESGDWYDVVKRDIPREQENIKEYKKRLALIEYLDSLHPEIKRVVDIVLNDDIDAALKTVFASLDAKTRILINATHGQSTVPQIGKAFKDKVLTVPNEIYTDSVRNFLQGVLGFYRAHIIHNPLPSSRNSIKASLSLFGLAHESFVLLDWCSKKRK